VVVEHDEETMRAADYLVDMGPGAGVHGGTVVACGTVAEVMASGSLTGDYLCGRRSIPTPAERRQAASWLQLHGLHAHNLKHIDVSIPLNSLVCITGVSGSGKSSLMRDTLLPFLGAVLAGEDPSILPLDHAEGFETIARILPIDQEPIGRTPRSNPATYTGAMTVIRDLFSQVPEARARGYGPGRFSFNVAGGRCQACQGEGEIRVAMHFLPDVFVPCDVCGGRRYNAETLQIHYKGKNIWDVLGMTVDEACSFFAAIGPLRRRLDTLRQVGLGYLQLGQSATTLSGGEAQRLKLARELAKPATKHTMYILDEPTTGLHLQDIVHLLDILRRLVTQGHSVVVIEHHLDVIKCADWLIDMGPEGGDAGGWVVASGTPEAVAQMAASHTGQALHHLLHPASLGPASSRDPGYTTA
jgi:excinuclease ABC subunit A